MKLSEAHRTFVQTYGTLVARLLVGFFFLIAGYSKAVNLPGTATYIGKASALPYPEIMAKVAMIIEIGGGLALIFGIGMDVAATALIVFTLATMYFFHGPASWGQNPMQQTIFYKNMAIVGGLLYMLAYGPGTGPGIRNVLRRVKEVVDDTTHA